LPALVAPVVLHAQQPAATATCAVDQNKPASVQRATLTMVQLQGAQKPDQRGRLLTDMVKLLSAEKSKDNPLGQDYMWATALVNWAGEPGTQPIMKRADLGYTTDPTGTIDVFAAADSALTRLAAASPACAAYAQGLRANQAWLNTINSAISALNAGKADSAEYWARRSLLMNQQSPYAFHVLSVVSQGKGDDAAATGYWANVIEKAGTDTNFRDLKQSAMYNIGAAKAQAAETAKGPDQKAKAQAAAAALQEFVAVAGNSPDASRAQPVIARMLSLAGDTAAITKLYADQIANPAKYNDLSLTQGGVVASQIGHQADAARLFELALEQNPYQRDALNNLSATYLNQKQYAKIIPVAKRLVDLDPSNGDNYAFLSLAFNGLAATATAGEKKALNDSALKYYQKSESMPIKVTFSEFTRGDTRAAIGMQVEALNLTPTAAPAATRPAVRGGAAAKPAAAAPAAAASTTPKTYNVKIEFLDKAGNVVDTQTGTVGPIAPGARATARFESAKPGIVGFRYAPLT
jgi:tetratricopeptide (TPR) repeat protein